MLLTRNQLSGAETTTFKIYNSDADGNPKDDLYTLRTPTLTEGSAMFFAAPPGANARSGHPPTTWCSRALATATTTWRWR